MNRYPETLLILVVLVLLTILWAMVQEGNKPYKIYQEIYKNRRLHELQALEAGGLSGEERDKILDLRLALKRDLPGLQEVVLKDGKKERCTSCHIGIEPISDSHPVETFGCSICHGGDPLSVSLPAAHDGLIGGKNPSDFRVADQGCGRTMPDGTACHQGDPLEERNHIQRVKTTIMATKAGEIANPRYSFGAQKSLRPLYGVAGIRGKEPVDREKTVSALRPLPYTRASDLPADSEGKMIRTDPTGAEYTFSGHRVDTELHQHCADQCHLWSRGVDQPYLFRASGCSSCHYLYDKEAYYRGGDPTIRRDEPGHGSFHRLTLKIPYSQCNHCHNRGVHSLFTMQFDKRTDLDETAGLSGEALRLQDYYVPMTLFTRCEYKLDCIDCHTDHEVMGDGCLYIDKLAQQRIRCHTCHGTLKAPPVIRKLTADEPPKIQRIMRTYSRNAGEDALFTSEGEILPHIRLEQGKLYLTGKVTGERFFVPQVFGSRCRQDPGNQESNSCHACHDIHLKP